MFGGFKNLIGEDRINAPERLANVTRKSMIKYLVTVAESKRRRNLAVGLVGGVVGVIMGGVRESFMKKAGLGLVLKGRGERQIENFENT